MKSDFDKERSNYDKEIETLKSQLAKKKRAIIKQKGLKEELELKNSRLEAEKASINTMLAEKTREYLEILEKNDELDAKNAKLRKEIIRVARERNDAEASAKNKVFVSKIKDNKIKVLKSQLKSHSKPRKAKKANPAAASLEIPKMKKLGKKLNLNKNYMPSSDRMNKYKSHAVLSNIKTGHKKIIFGNESDDSSGVSDVDENEYYNVDDSDNDSKAPSVVLPNIIGRSKQDVYQSLSDLHSVKDKELDAEGLDHASDFERYDVE